MRTMGNANSQRQVTTSTMNAETNMPIMPPPPATPVQMPIAFAFSSGGNVEVMTDSVTGMIIAAPTPASARAAIIISVDPLSAPPRLAAMKTPRPMTRTRLRPHRSPIAPIGISSAASASV